MPPEPGEEPENEGLGRPVAAVRPIHRRRVNHDEHLVLVWFRLAHFRDPNDVGCAVTRVNRCLQEWECSAGQLQALMPAPDWTAVGSAAMATHDAVCSNPGAVRIGSSACRSSRSDFVRVSDQGDYHGAAARTSALTERRACDRIVRSRAALIR